MQSRQLGFSGTSTFNPRQVELINEHFSPTQDELRYAARVAHGSARARDHAYAFFAVGGRLVGLPIGERARSLLHLVKQLGLEIPAVSA